METEGIQGLKVRSRRRAIILVSVAAVALGLLGAGVVIARAGLGGTIDRGHLTPTEYVLALRLARTEIAKQDAQVSIATATVWRGTVQQPNLPGTCASGQILEVDLVGQFPHVGVSPDPNAATGPDMWLVYRADAATGQACDVGVGVGHFTPAAHSANLLPALSAS